MPQSAADHPDHHPCKCYACGRRFRGQGWRYQGTLLVICPECYKFQKRPETLDPVNTDDLAWKSAADKFLEGRRGPLG